MTSGSTNRRSFLKSSLILGCSTAASPLITPITFAATPNDARLVVIILRGGMDGLDVVQPYGDPALKTHRNHLRFGEAAGASDLDGFFALHPNLNSLMPLWHSGELAFAHAVSTPYRNKRSHFDGQDVLENGGMSASEARSATNGGWLNRMLSLIPGTTAETALAAGRTSMLLLSGREPHTNWSPDTDLELSQQTHQLLRAVYKNDPLFYDAHSTAFRLLEQHDPKDDMTARKATRAKALADLSAARLNAESRIAAFSLFGWDTHVRQSRSIANALDELSTAVLTLRDGLGENWNKTMVVCLTEFGRTVRENGNSGTDHGTGGAMIMTGGALRSAKIHANWPGLGQGDLYRDRDLLPTDDVRRYCAWIMRDLFGLRISDLERIVFPGLDMGLDPKIVA